MKKILFAIAAFILASCAPDKPKTEGEDFGSINAQSEKAALEAAAKGIGQIQNVTLNMPLEQDKVGRGKAIYEMKFLKK